MAFEFAEEDEFVGIAEPGVCCDDAPPVELNELADFALIPEGTDLAPGAAGGRDKLATRGWLIGVPRAGASTALRFAATC